MKAQVFNINGEKTKTIDLPSQFNEEIRPDLIRKVVLAIQSNKRQPYGANPRAGKEYSAKLSRRRRDYKGAYGRGISRVPRKVMLRRGTQFIYTGALAPGTVGGRRAHPPKAEKSFKVKINKKEKVKAIRSALAATLNKDLLKKKGFTALDNLPIIIEKEIEAVKKTQDLKKLFEKLKLKVEINRCDKKRIRAGKGKTRNRKYKKKLGPLVIVSQTCPLIKATKNLQGFEISNVKTLNANLLAPGAHPGRLLIWSLPAMEKLIKENLFTK